MSTILPLNQATKMNTIRKKPLLITKETTQAFCIRYAYLADTYPCSPPSSSGYLTTFCYLNLVWGQFYLLFSI